MSRGDPVWGWIENKAGDPTPWGKGTVLGKPFMSYGAKKGYGSELYSNLFKQNKRIMVLHVGNPREVMGFRLGWIQGLN